MEWTEVKEFGWGDARLRPGMTKQEVLEQIAKSGLPEYKGQFGIRPPPPEMLQKDVWRLSCGTSTGAAPGFAAVRLTFHDGKLAKIEQYSGPMPA